MEVTGSQSSVGYQGYRCDTTSMLYIRRFLKRNVFSTDSITSNSTASHANAHIS